MWYFGMTAFVVCIILILLLGYTVCEIWEIAFRRKTNIVSAASYFILRLKIAWHIRKYITPDIREINGNDWLVTYRLHCANDGILISTKVHNRTLELYARCKYSDFVKTNIMLGGTTEFKWSIIEETLFNPVFERVCNNLTNQYIYLFKEGGNGIWI